ncbi:hypothetical protein [Halobacterium noricense]|nr:hypothetical protein [Halobacterium noricense]UHH24789.1 hypothetical protein LT974_12470 [Halobacterium noricense]
MRWVSAAEVANAMFSPPPKLLTASTDPAGDISGPPLFPGLTAASV